MAGRVLIVDGTATHRIVLRVKLASAYYDVDQAESGAAAMECVKRMRPDILIASDNLPDMTGAELCRSVRSTTFGHDLPVILIRSEEDAEARLAALRAGAEDMLARPLDEMLLFSRLRSLMRAREAERELRLRDETGQALGLAEDRVVFSTRARIAVVPGAAAEQSGLAAALRAGLSADIASACREDVLRGCAGRTDVFVLIEGTGGSALELLSEIRVRHETRRATILYVASAEQRREAATALDLGADDLVIGRALPEEIALRLKKLMHRKAVADRLRATIEEGIRAALIDPLTGLHNRRYALPHLDRVDQAARISGKPYGVVMIDIDRFKTVNDRFGHAAGDMVLTAVAEQLGRNLRVSDLVARFGGEEFLVTLPETDMRQALGIADRLCACIRAKPLPIGRGLPPIPVSISAGVTVGPAPGDLETGALIAAADRALYEAKNAGRDRAVGTRVEVHLPGKRSMPAASRSA